MSKFPRLFGLLFFLLLGVAALGISSSVTPTQAAPAASVVAQACDPSGSVNGTADPSTVMPGQFITYTVRGFTPGEEVSFWFTTPRGEVFGTNAPLCCAPQGGTIVFARVRIPEEFRQEPGRWAFTVQGANSNHTAVVYFCVVTQIQPTSTAVPPTNTVVPPTNTAEPATSTAVPASPTVGTSPTVETSPTVATSPTAETSPTAATGSPTVPGMTPTTVATTPTALPTMTSMPTQEPTAMPVPTAEVPPVPVPTVVGMPRTGQTDNTLLTIMALMALGVAGVGVMARRTSRARR